MRKLYQILYNVVRLTDAPGGGRFLSRGTLWRRQVSLSGGHFGSGVSLSGGHFGSGVSLSGGHFGVGRFARGKGARSYEARFSPSRSPFPGTSLFCAVVWCSVLANTCMLLYWWRQAEPIFFSAGRKAVCAADLFLVVIVLLALICSYLLFYCWR